MNDPRDGKWVDGEWVDDRLASLEAVSGWQPNPARALTKIRQKNRGRTIQRRWSWATAAVAAGLVAFFALPTRGTCAPRLWGDGCRQPGTVGTDVVKALPVAPPAPTAVSQGPAPVIATHRLPEPPPARENFKQSGLPSAPIDCEIYSDYECPACAAFFRDTLPLLVSEYVETGKIRLLHRDFPLPMHRYARLAARYANAAGEIGSYELAVSQIFRTQSQWNATGDIGVRLAEVLPPGDILKVRRLVEGDSHLDDTVAADTEMALADEINQTPTLVIVAHGKRQKIAPIPPASVLKSYLDRLLQE